VWTGKPPFQLCVSVGANPQTPSLSFQKTNQESVLNDQATDLPAVLSGVRSICAVASTILGNASVANNPTATQTQVTPTGGALSVLHGNLLLVPLVVVAAVLVGEIL
jgi:hypothetical protein